MIRNPGSKDAKFDLKTFIYDPKSTLLLVGYQAAGSLGRKLQDGAKKVTIMGKEVSVKASVVSLSGFSAHRDSEGLFDFVQHSAGTLKNVFVAMGEEKSSIFMVQKIRDYLGVQSMSPKQGERFDIEL